MCIVGAILSQRSMNNQCTVHFDGSGLPLVQTLIFLSRSVDSKETTDESPSPPYL